MAHLSISLLGTFRVTLAGERVTKFESDKVRALLAYLAVEADRPHRRETLADLLWPDSSERAARNNLRQALFKLRQAIGDRDAAPPFLRSTRKTIQFNATSDHWLDTTAFAALLTTCQTHPHRHLETCKPCIQRLRQAIELYRGDLLKGLFVSDSVAFEEWRLFKQEEFHRLALVALHHLVRYHERRGEYNQAHRYAQQQLELEPWREEAHRQLMRTLALSGRRGAALAQYETCRHILAEESGVEPVAETTALYEQIRVGAGLRPAPVAPPHNLPLPLTPFIGREAELAQICERLFDPTYRLLTLVGAGGVGKTRLALTAVRQVMDDFDQGVWFVPLVGVPGGGTQTAVKQLHNTLATAIADTLNLVFAGKGEPWAQLLDYLRRKETVLLLDNFEHLLDGVDFILEIIKNAPHVTVLVTSRERLNFQAEYAMRVEGLPVPAPDGAPLVEWTGTSVQLFAERAERTPTGFVLDEHNLPDVIRVCQFLEGFPLGIELAAAWVEQLTCSDIARAIRQNLDFLATSMRDVPERHRSMRAVFEGSWRLLCETERGALAQATVFRRGFSEEAAEAVISEQSIHHILTSLVDKSLLRCTATGRYEMHELLRQFAAEKLDEIEKEIEKFQSPSASPSLSLSLSLSLSPISIWGRHSAFYLGFVAQREAALNGQEPQKASAEIRSEIDNIRQAWHWAVAQAKLAEIDRGLNGLADFYHLTGLFQEGNRAFGMAVERVRALMEAADEPERDVQRVLSKLLAAQARALNAQAMYDQTIAAARDAIDLAQVVQAVSVVALGYLQWGEALWRQGEYATARARLEQALTLARTAQLRREEANSLLNLGVVCRNQGAHAGARAYYEQSLRISREMGNRRGECATLNNLGIVTAEQGDYAEAMAHFEQSLRISREISDRRDEAKILNNLGVISNNLGDHETTRRRSEQALTINREIGDHDGAGHSLTYLAHALAGLGNLQAAAATYDQALRLRRELGQPRRIMNPLAGLARVSLAQENLAQAQAQVEEILSYLERNTMDGIEEPFRVYLTCYRVLRATQDPRVPEILTTAYHLLQERAAKIGDEELRRSFLENTAAHREILEEYAKAGEQWNQRNLIKANSAY